MCLYKTHFLPKISFKPIEVYKILSKSNASKSGYETPFLCTEVFFNTTMKATKHWKTSLFKKSIHGEGVHAYITKYGFTTVEAEIPSFTPYWIGDNSDIAASRMKLVKKL